MSSEQEQYKQKVTRLFNLIANDYDHPSLRFFPFCADAMVHFLRPKPGCKILDIATGTGAAAVAAGQKIGSGRVQAIDLSESMIEKAVKNVEKMALNNVDFHIMDATKPEFKSQYFDNVMCAFGLFFLPDRQAALKQWLRVLKPDGKLIFTSFAETAFQPMSEIFRSQMEAFGVSFENAAWQKLQHKQQCEQLLLDAGMHDIKVSEKQMGYHLNNENDWWAVIWNSGFRGYIEQLTPEQLGKFQQQHMEAVRELVTDKGLWMDVSVLFTLGTKEATTD